MLLRIYGKIADIKPVGYKSIEKVQTWYSQQEYYGLATGGKEAGNIFGLVTGKLKTINETVLWIRTFLIDAAWQRQGFGTHSFSILCSHAAEHLKAKRIYLSVSEDNQAGIRFFTKMGMSCIKDIEAKNSGNNSRVLIFGKVL